MLTNEAIAAAPVRERAYRLTDSRGLHVHVAPTGCKSIRWRYRFRGREKTLTLGQHPGLTIEKARMQALIARNSLKAGFDPSDRRARLECWSIDQLEALPLPLNGSRVYFAQVTSGHIKIGVSTNVPHRVAALQHAHAEPVNLLATMLGGHAHEQLLHRIFARDRDHGEWFSPSEPLLAYIESLSTPSRGLFAAGVGL